ncbi:formylglycine-generating enzyme family protein [bacterium]|nr:formylglycine-generating enzyme family protein [bacterium]
MNNQLLKLSLFSFLAIAFLSLPFISFGSNTYSSKIPNGSVFSCDNCHGGTFMNDFGNDFLGNNNKWNQILASKDSDGDGYTNGAELQDPNGSWFEGHPQPGDSNKVTNPGDPASFPQEATPTPTPTAEPTPTPPPSGVQKIEIDTDKGYYKLSDTLKVLVTLHLGDSPLDVDIYLVMTDTLGSPYFFPSWSKTPDFVRTTLPANLKVDKIKLLQFDIPNTLPLISNEGQYKFYFALAESGTLEFLGGIASTTFEIFSGCPSDMLSIPEGEFTMGDTSGWGFEDEKPAHDVIIGSYCIDKYEYPNIAGEIPEFSITYYEMESFCLDSGKRLCTEAEWERACSGPDNNFYPYGNDYDDTKCYVDYLSESTPVPSGDNPDCKSGYDVYDMSGSVWEWTADWYYSYYYELRIYDNPTGPAEGEYKVLRGGAWYSGKIASRCSHRYVGFPDASRVGSGGRCCK